MLRSHNVLTSPSWRASVFRTVLIVVLWGMSQGLCEVCWFSCCAIAICMNIRTAAKTKVGCCLCCVEPRGDVKLETFERINI